LAIVINPKIAPIPTAEQYQIARCQAFGIRDSASYLKEKAKNEKVFVGTIGVLGNVNILHSYLWGEKNIEIKGYTTDPSLLPKEVLQKSQTVSTYYFTIQPKTAKLTSTAPLSVIREKTYDKLDECVFRLYKVGQNLTRK